MTGFTLKPGELSLADLRRLDDGVAKVTLDAGCHEAIDAAHATVERIVAGGVQVYGVNTGVGSLAQTAISIEQSSDMQRRLVLSHAAGTGPQLADGTVRRVILLKANALAQGFSGIRRSLIDALLALYNADVLPCIPSKGSVGASGDLAPLAHLALTLLGEGEVRCGGETLPAAEGLSRAGLEPITFGAKEALAMLNGTQVSAALAIDGLFAAETVFAAAVIAGSLSVEATLASHVPFDPRISAARGQAGQIDVAAVYTALLKGSAIVDSHADCDRVQDPYSLRCQPQVMGACLDHLRFAADIFLREANGVTDNPLVFSTSGDVLSGGNFHAEPGLNSGFMEAQVVAAALASENKALAHPSSVDSIPTSANQEDHVSMAAYAARRLVPMADNSAAIVAIELLAAAQGLEFRRPLKSSEALERVHAVIRVVVPALDEDRYMAPDIEAAKSLVQSGAFDRLMPGGLLPSLS